MGKMTKQEFEAIYKNITSTQHSVLEMFLEGRLDPEISQLLHKDRTAVSSNISKICKLFGVENEPGAYTQRENLIKLFVNHKSELVGEKLLIKFGKRMPETPKVLQVPYVERHPIESECYSKILEPGAFIRIKAPKHTGKTVLLKRILGHARCESYQTIILDLATASSSTFCEYQKFLQWFCVSVGRCLGLANKLADFWDSDFYDEHDNTKTYFEDYLLKQQTVPLVLVLENVDRVFEQELFSMDFCRLLRSWSQLHAETNHFAELWQKLRLIVVHSTNVYGSLDIHSSPLDGVGLTVTLLDFTPEQVQDLVNYYQKNWLNSSQTQEFMAMFGGHPYLVQQALAYLKNEKLSLEKLCEIAPTEESPFKSHLREHLRVLRQHPELAIAYHKVVAESQSTQLETNLTFKLESMGLVLVDKDNCVPRCGLYKQYFSSRLNLTK
jgi:serine/threonine-protein kinase